MLIKKFLWKTTIGNVRGWIKSNLLRWFTSPDTQSHLFLCMIYWDGLMRTKTCLIHAFAELPYDKTTSVSPQVKRKMTSNSRQFFSVRRFPTAGTSPQKQGPFQELDMFPSQEPASKFSRKVACCSLCTSAPLFSLLNNVMATKYGSVWWIWLEMLAADTD